MVSPSHYPVEKQSKTGSNLPKNNRLVKARKQEVPVP